MNRKGDTKEVTAAVPVQPSGANRNAQSCTWYTFVSILIWCEDENLEPGRLRH